ncbi:hypothetical protein [Variovorax sp. UC74_104]|uniref:hypothetical protein n=1 Tax=Variovorax sp. UC74_104 TaxID=3374555 RepID=UPI003756A4B2
MRFLVLVEKERIGRRGISRNWRWCRQQNRVARKPPMATDGLEPWEEFTADTGEEKGLRRHGLLYLSNDVEEIDGWLLRR